jgi:DNA processing protein
MAADDAELLDWLVLTLTPGVGGESARKLLAALGSPQAALAAGRSIWREVAGSACELALCASRDEAQARAGQALAWRAEDPTHRHLLTLGDADYPAALLQIADPPVVLYALGDLARLRQPSVAIVGSREATAQGLDHARLFAQALSQAGVAVVSGLALGIDGAAHEGALTGPGSTIAVVGTGLDRVYPRRHLALARRIAELGLVLSEFALGTPSLPANFPRRNRIIAGLASGTLVVEAALRSGSLITARLACEAGREVFALPGPISSMQSRGCHQLIRDGAALVEEPDEILQILREGDAKWDAMTSAQGTALNPAASECGEALIPRIATRLATPVSLPTVDPVLEAMGYAPLTLDTLSIRCGWPTDQLLAHLLTLELDGHLARLPGGLLQRRGQA